jgi:hypothetical protein
MTVSRVNSGSNHMFKVLTAEIIDETFHVLFSSNVSSTLIRRLRSTEIMAPEHKRAGFALIDPNLAECAEFLAISDISFSAIGMEPVMFRNPSKSGLRGSSQGRVSTNYTILPLVNRKDRSRRTTSSIHCESSSKW